jgi:hypothetical protein
MRPTLFHPKLVLLAAAAAALVVGASIASCGGGSPGTPDGGADATQPETAPPPDDAGSMFRDVRIGTDGGVVGPIPETCAESKFRNSYIGCDYWPTVTLNPVYEGFSYAVAVSNPQKNPVTVTVEGGALSQPVVRTVQPGTIETIELPWVAALKGPQFDLATVVSKPGASRIVKGGAYHLTTTLPVSVYQFSPLQYEIDAGAGCPGYGEGGAGPHCYSYSNDASLLLPATVATGDYGILGWPSFGITPGFLAVVATEDGTQVTVHPAGRTQGVPEAGPPILLRGDAVTYTLSKGDVLEMFSDIGDVQKPKYNHDLSGSIVQANKPVLTYAGHGCTFIPEDKKACDHLESSMLPIQTLGTEYIVSLPKMPHGEPMHVRIMAFFDNTSVAFDPPVAGRNGALLQTGDVLDLPGVDTSFAIVANGRIAVTQHLLGGYTTVTDGGQPSPDLGDPSLATAIPLQEYRSTYSFLAPNTYSENWIDVITPLGNVIVLDGTPIPQNAYTPVGGQPFGVAHVKLPSSGPEGHAIEATTPFGLLVYGFGSRTSYMYPGGLDLRAVAIPPPPPPN